MGGGGPAGFFAAGGGAAAFFDSLSSHPTRRSASAASASQRLPPINDGAYPTARANGSCDRARARQRTRRRPAVGSWFRSFFSGPTQVERDRFASGPRSAASARLRLLRSS